jgi:hypothetical protein
MTEAELIAALQVAALVRQNLESRIGALLGENLELLARIHYLEQAAEATRPAIANMGNGDGVDDAATVPA